MIVAAFLMSAEDLSKICFVMLKTFINCKKKSFLRLNDLIAEITNVFNGSACLVCTRDRSLFMALLIWHWIRIA